MYIDIFLINSSYIESHSRLQKSHYNFNQRTSILEKTEGWTSVNVTHLHPHSPAELMIIPTLYTKLFRVAKLAHSLADSKIQFLDSIQKSI